MIPRCKCGIRWCPLHLAFRFFFLILLAAGLAGCDPKQSVKDAAIVCLDGWQHRVYRTYNGYFVPVPRFDKNQRLIPCQE